MERIQLLVNDAETRHILKDCLTAQYEVIEGHESLNDYFDLCIVDKQALTRLEQQLQAWKKVEYPVFGPILLIALPQEIDTASPLLWQSIDEIVSHPINKAELSAKVELLLRTRRFSLENKLRQGTLVYVSKAIESTSDAVIITDLQGQVIYHNQAFIDLYEYTAEEINTQGLANALFIKPETGMAIFGAARQGQSWKGEIELKRKNGQLALTWLYVDCVLDENQRSTSIVWIGTDITERRRMEVAEREQRALAEALRDTATALTSTLNLAEVFERILENVGRVVPHDAANIMIVENGVARVARGRGYTAYGVNELVLSLRLPVHETPHLRQMADTRQTLIIPDTTFYPGESEEMRRKWMGSYAGAPIYLHDQLLGFINLDSSTRNFFTPIHADRLLAFAEQATIAIHNARLYEQAQALATMEERQRIARELHDAVSQALFSASVIAEALSRQHQHDPDKVRQRLVQLHQLTRGALAETRALLLELRPTSLMEVELGDLIRQLILAIQSRKYITAEISIEGQCYVPSEVKLGLYRIAQEALNNVVKHSRATRLQVSLRSEEDFVELDIQDNGRGFDSVSPQSLGLSIMRERAEAIGATLAIDSQVGHGTRVLARWSDGHGKEPI